MVRKSRSFSAENSIRQKSEGVIFRKLGQRTNWTIQESLVFLSEARNLRTSYTSSYCKIDVHFSLVKISSLAQFLRRYNKMIRKRSIVYRLRKSHFPEPCKCGNVPKTRKSMNFPDMRFTSSILASLREDTLSNYRSLLFVLSHGLRP